MNHLFIKVSAATKNFFALFLIAYLLLPTPAAAQEKRKTDRSKQFYFSWGYNSETYTSTDIHVSQPSLNNDYTFNGIVGHDYKGWDNHILEKDLTIPQYNYRLGYFFNKAKNLAFEINFDHTKFIVTQGQIAHLTGTLGGRQVDTSFAFLYESGFEYFLNNGANFLCFNLVKQMNIWANKRQSISIDFLGKAGLGPVVPHVQNILFGKANKSHFQIGGWNAGVEAGIKVTFFKNVFLEYTNKLDYASYSGLRIYEGTARQAFGCHEMVLNLGVNFRLGKRLAE